MSSIRLGDYWATQAQGISSSIHGYQVFEGKSAAPLDADGFEEHRQKLGKRRSRMSSDKPWENPSRTKLWQEMKADEKAEWLRAQLNEVNGLNAKLQQMSCLYAMLSSQVQEIGRAVKTIEKS